MSIVITIMVEEQGLIMYGDKKVVRSQFGRDWESNDFIKVIKLSTKLACGINGEGTWQEKLLAMLTKRHYVLPSQLITTLNGLTFTTASSGNIILGGIYDDDKPFIWVMQINRNKPGQLFHNTNQTIISTESIELAKECGTEIDKEILAHNNLHEACINTIKFASLKKPNLISSTYDFFSVNI